MKHGFDRKIFTPRVFWSDLGYLTSNVGAIIKATRNPELGETFMTKTMLVVTAVNGCSYCTWFHAKQAVSSGMSDAEIQDMLNLQFETGAEAFEVPALLFAQHYAETDRNPDPKMIARLNETYGEETASHVMLFIRMIFFGNLFGNTFDAFLSRLHGEKAKDSSLIFETVLFALTFWFMLPIKWAMNRKNPKSEEAPS